MSEVIAAIIGLVGGIVITWLSSRQQRKQLIQQHELEVKKLQEISAIESRNSQESTIYEEKRKGDRRLLEKLWPLIDSENIYRLDSETQNYFINSEWYMATIRHFLYLRDLHRNPQNHFSEAQLENSFSVFWETLESYDSEMSDNYSTDFRRGKQEYISHTKLKSDHSRYLSHEDFLQKLNDNEHGYRRTVNKVLEVCEKHRELVKAIKIAFPDFDFDKISDTE